MVTICHLPNTAESSKVFIVLACGTSQVKEETKAHFLSGLHHSDVKSDAMSHNGVKKEEKITRNFRTDYIR